jgi:gamma-glutamyltranspeptidase / glutathione hydrolase
VLETKAASWPMASRDFQLPGRSTVHAANGMAATSHPLASLAAIEILNEGGSAADAAVAASALLGVIEPQSTGIGGDCFILHQKGAAGPVEAFNGSGRAPAAVDVDWYLSHKFASIPLTHAHAVTVPGAVDAWATLLRCHGRLGLERDLRTAIEAAESGYVVAPRVAWDWAHNVEKLRKGVNTELLLPGGDAPQAGDVIEQPLLSETLRMIAKGGEKTFYEGPIAEDIFETLRLAGGHHSLEDFASHSTEVREAISIDYHGREVWQCPPNGPGITMLLMLNFLKGFDLSSYNPLGIERFHLEAEASRFAYMVREREVGDPQFVNVDCARLLTPEFVAEAQANVSFAHLVEMDVVRPPANPSTVYLCVVDRDLNICSLISSIAYAFGSAIVSAKTGVLLQNRGAGFRVLPGHPNCIAPRKRPLHTIIPSLVTKNGRAELVFGVMGGQYQPVGQTHVFNNLFDYGFDLQAAIDAPRALHYEGVYQLERGVDEDVVRGLERIGHNVRRAHEPLGGAQAIRIDWDRGTLIGASDPRKDGCALGY